jgi:hypothetical protein
MNEQIDHEEWQMLDHELMWEEILVHGHELYQLKVYVLDEQEDYQ